MKLSKTDCPSEQQAVWSSEAGGGGRQIDARRAEKHSVIGGLKLMWWAYKNQHMPMITRFG